MGLRNWGQREDGPRKSSSGGSGDCTPAPGDTITRVARRREGRRHLAASSNNSSAPAVAIERRPRKNPLKKGENNTQHELLEELALRPLATPLPQAPRSRAADAGAAVTGLALLLLLRLPRPPQQASRLPTGSATAAAAAVAET